MNKDISRGVSAAFSAMSTNSHPLAGKAPVNILQQLPDVQNRFKIDTNLRLAHFMSQCAHESGHFTRLYENLNYSSEALGKMFRKYFPSHDEANYHRKPEMIANRIYGNRMGNGPESSGDGWKYRGRGALQITGKDNYTAFGKAIGVDILSNPGVVADKYALFSAAWFFSTNNILPICDKGPSEDIIRQVTKKVNGGYNGIEDRIVLFNEYYSILSQ